MLWTLHDLRLLLSFLCLAAQARAFVLNDIIGAQKRRDCHQSISHDRSVAFQCPGCQVVLDSIGKVRVEQGPECDSYFSLNPFDYGNPAIRTTTFSSPRRGNGYVSEGGGDRQYIIHNDGLYQPNHDLSDPRASTVGFGADLYSDHRANGEVRGRSRSRSSKECTMTKFPDGTKAHICPDCVWTVDKDQDIVAMAGDWCSGYDE